MRWLLLLLLLILPLPAADVVYLIRHCEPGSDGQLTEAGRARADRIGTWLVDKGITGLISSPKARTVETAQRIRARLPASVPHVSDPELDQDLNDRQRFLATVTRMTLGRQAIGQVIVTHAPVVRAFLDANGGERITADMGVVVKVTIDGLNLRCEAMTIP